jgi:hypothetical protein
MLALPTNASPFCKNLNNANVKTSGGSGCSDSPVEARNASGAAARCGPTKVDVQGEGKQTIVVFQSAHHDGRTDFQTRQLDRRGGGNGLGSAGQSSPELARRRQLTTGAL